MVATSGARLISEEAIDALKSCLLPMATVLTPNIPEAEVLAGMKIQSQADMIRAAEEIGTKYHCAVLCKGGHQSGSTIRTRTEQDVLYPVQSHQILQKNMIWMSQ